MSFFRSFFFQLSYSSVDKQILGFSFVRSQTTQQRILNYDEPSGVPVFDLHRDENNEIYIGTY